MWVMPLQALDALDDALDRALTYANGDPVYALSGAERGAIHAVYQLYDDLLGQPHPALRPHALDTCRPHLHDAYNQVQVGGRLVDLRARLLASAISCPYCGFGEPRDLDHYLPRSVYGELAIYPRNLIPSCGPCNNAKRAVVPGMDPVHGPGLIHPYLQELPEVDFLVADVDFQAGALDVTFRVDPNGVHPDLAAKLQYQLDRLKLNERYPKQINKFVSEQRVAMLMVAADGAEALAGYLRRCAASLAGSYHPNDWRVALLRALANEPLFCEAPELYLGLEPQAA